MFTQYVGLMEMVDIPVLETGAKCVGVRVPYPTPNMHPLSVGSAGGLQNRLMQVRVLSGAPHY